MWYYNNIIIINLWNDDKFISVIYSCDINFRKICPNIFYDFDLK